MDCLARLAACSLTLCLGLSAGPALGQEPPPVEAEIRPLVLECDPVYALSPAADPELECGLQAAGLGNVVDLNDAGQIGFTDDTGVYRYELDTDVVTTIATTGDTGGSCGFWTEWMNPPAATARINEDGQVAWMASTCLQEDSPGVPSCPDCEEGDAGGGLELCGLSQFVALFWGDGEDFAQLTDASELIYTSDFEMLEGGDAAYMGFDNQRCEFNPGNWSMSLVNESGISSVLSFDDSSPVPDTFYGRMLPTGAVSMPESFIHLSPGFELPAVFHAFAYEPEEAGYAMLVDMNEAPPLEAELVCGGPISGPGGGGGGGPGPGPGNSFSGEGSPKGPSSALSGTPQVYVPSIPGPNKPDLGCVDCLEEADWVTVFAGRQDAAGRGIPACLPQAEVLLQLDAADQLDPVELLEFGSTQPLGQPAGSYLDSYSTPVTVSQGTAVFAGAFFRPGDGNVHALFAVTAPGEVHVLAEQGDPVPDLPGYSFMHFGAPTINSSHEVAFHASYLRPDESVDGGLFVAELVEESTCPGDLNGDGQVNGSDLVIVLASWGACGGCPADLNGDGQVNGSDLVVVLAGWGSCS